MDIVQLVLIFIVGTLASAYGTLVGGSGLMTIPFLIFMGLNPQQAIATNKIGVLGLASAGLYKFNKKQMIDKKLGIIITLPAVLGALLGAHTVLQVNETLLKQILAVLTIGVLIVISVKHDIGLKKIKKKITLRKYFVGGIFGFGIGFWAGFYGAGNAVLFSYLLILLFGQTFLESAATRKIPGLMMTIFSLFVFLLYDVIVYPVAIVLLISMTLGSYVGVHYSDSIGNIWIKRMFFVVVMIMALKLLI